MAYQFFCVCVERFRTFEGNFYFFFNWTMYNYKISFLQIELTRQI